MCGPVRPWPEGGDIRRQGLGVGWPERCALFFADENGGENAAQQFGKHPGPAGLLTGPEGGFDDTERALIRALPQTYAITLGPRVLRGETAAIAATALWMATVGDW